MKHQKGQTSFEYAVLITVVIAAILSLMIYAKRAVVGRFRASAEAIGQQWSAQNTNETFTLVNRGARKEDTFQNGKSSSTIVPGTVSATNAADAGVTDVTQELSARSPKDGVENVPTLETDTL